MKTVKTAGWAERAGKAGAEGIMEGVRTRLGPILEEQIGPFWEKLHQQLPETAAKAVRQAGEEAKTFGSRAVRNISLPVGIGAGAGALAAPEGERGEGAVRGAAGGLAGGLVGAAWGHNLPSAAGRALTLGGSTLGGIGAGATLHQKKEKPVKNKYAGVTLDAYDDKGATLKALFPTAESLPDIIKEADIRPLEKLGNEDFALIALDEGHVMRKYACHDPGTTAMSVVYFMEHGEKLPESAQKIAAANLVQACVRFDILPPNALVKTAGSTNVVLRRAKALSKVWNRPRPRTFSKGEHEALWKLRSKQRGHEIGRNPESSRALEIGSIRKMLSQAKEASADVLAGGKADKKTNKDFSQKQMEMGKKVEMEHTKSPQVAAEISRDHLEEFGDYYTRLDKMEEQAKKEKNAVELPVGRTVGSLAGKITPGKALAVGAGGAALGYGGYHLVKKIFGSKPQVQKVANVVDITGKSPTPKFKVASPAGPDDYAVVLNGCGYYPIHTWDLVKKAEVYYQEEKGRMQPEVRRQYAVKLADKAASMGYPLDPDILEAGSTGWASKGHLKAAVEMRKIACQPGTEDRKFLDELFEKRASLEPPTYAEVLRRFDVEHGLDKGWDHVILDPWASTFGLDKMADVVWEDGNDRVTSDQLMALSQNHAAFNVDFTEEFRKEFQKDPVAIFESLPLPQKRVIARLAADFPYQSEITQATGD